MNLLFFINFFVKHIYYNKIFKLKIMENKEDLNFKFHRIYFI